MPAFFDGGEDLFDTLMAEEIAIIAPCQYLQLKSQSLHDYGITVD